MSKVKHWIAVHLGVAVIVLIVSFVINLVVTAWVLRTAGITFAGFLGGKAATYLEHRR